MKLRPANIILTIMAILVLAASTTFAAESKIDWSGNYITVTGYGAPPAHSINIGQARMMARRAAVVDAYRQMAEIVNGVQVDSETTVRDMVVENDLIKTKVTGLVRSARVVEERQVEGGYEVTMTVPLFGVSGSVAASVLPQNTTKESFPMPAMSRTTPPLDGMSTGSSAANPTNYTIQREGIYTGLVIDCHGLGLKPAMSPVIKNANLESIYGYKNLDYNYVIANGMASYAHNMSQATRAGSHPLVLRAEKLVGMGVNPVLSMRDADKALIENQATHFLDKTNVVFLY